MDAREPFGGNPAADRAFVELEELGNLAEREEALERRAAAEQFRPHRALPRPWLQAIERPRCGDAWQSWSSAPPCGARSVVSRAPGRGAAAAPRSRHADMGARFAFPRRGPGPFLRARAQ